MINRPTTFCLLLLVTTGCQPFWRQATAPVDPVLASDMTCSDVVAHLNAQHQGLNGWRSGSTVMWVRMPNGVPVRLEGLVACQAPQYFRLTAENLYAEADLGSNASRCWMYIRPGDPAVLTWKHQDTSLLQQLPTGMPYIDPTWLMLVLGVKPLDPADYSISPGPAGIQEFWLTAVEDSPTGRPLRRVIKVDRIRGVVREHTLYDNERNPLVRAVLNQHRIHDGHHIPTKVKLEFPQMDSEISLSFRTIETNPYLSDNLWKVPDRNMRVVDLGQMLRSKFPHLRNDTNSAATARTTESNNAAGHPFADPGDEAFYAPRKQNPFPAPEQQLAFDRSDSTVDGQSVSEAETTEPDWDTPISATRTISPGGTERGQQPAVPRSPWPRLWPF